MASSGVYPHRDHPHHGAPIYNARALGETLDRVKQEFEVLVGEVAASRDQRERYEATISSQADELEKIRGALHELEAQHNKVRAQYEYEVRVLRSEAAHPHAQPHRQGSLGQREQQQREQQQREQQQARPGTASGSGSGSALPTLSSPSVFMGGGGPSSAHNVHSAAHSPVLDHHGHPREHSRDPMREGRDRDLREREREHSRDAREVQRARFLEGGSGGGNKRIKLDQGESTRLPLPLIGPGGPAGSPSTPSASRRAPTPSSALPGGFPPQAHTPLGTPAHGAHPTLPPMSLAPPPHPQTPHQQQPPAHLPYPPPAGQLAPYTNAGAHMNDFLAALDPHALPPAGSSDLVKVEGGGRAGADGPDWFVVYNPAVKRRVLDVALVHTFAHETVVCCIQFSADGKYLATGCNRTAQIFDVASGRRVCVLADPGPDEKAGMEKAATATGDLYIRSVRFSPDGRYLATGAEDERVRVWDIEKRTIRAVFEGHHQDIYSLDFSADGRRLVSGSGDATVRIWELEEEYEYDEEDRYNSSEYHNGRRRRPPPLVLTAHPETTMQEDDAGVMAVALSPDGTLVAAGCVDALVRVWALSQAPPQNGSRDGGERGGPSLTATLVQVLRGHTNSVHSVVWTKDGSGVVSGALDNTVRVWDLRGAAKREREGKKGMGMAEVGCTVFAGHKDYVLSVGISRDAQWIVSGSKDRGVHFWDRDGVVQCLLQGHKNSVISTSLHPVGNLLATGSGDKLARIWNYNAV